MAIPESFPNPALVEAALGRIEGVAREVLQGRIENLREPQRRVALWLLAAEGLALSEYRLDETSGLRRLALGVEGDRRRVLAEGRRRHHPFGWLNRGRPREYFGDGSLRITLFLDPGYHYEGPGVLQMEDEEGRSQAILVKSDLWVFIPHALVNLLNATVCCWVAPSAGGDGLLTADHAVFEGGYSYLENHTMAQVLWRAPGGLDAAVLDARPGGSLSGLPITLR